VNPLVETPAWVGPGLGRALDWLATDRGLRRFKSLVWLLLVVGALSFLVQGADTVARPVVSNIPLPGAPAPHR
jgi:hypothetical protein